MLCYTLHPEENGDELLGDELSLKQNILWFLSKKKNFIILCYTLHLEENGDELFGDYI